MIIFIKKRTADPANPPALPDNIVFTIPLTKNLQRPRIIRLKSGQHTEQRCFAAAIAAKKQPMLALSDSPVDLVQEVAIAGNAAQIFDCHDYLLHSLTSSFLQLMLSNQQILPNQRLVHMQWRRKALRCQ